MSGGDSKVEHSILETLVNAAMPKLLSLLHNILLRAAATDSGSTVAGISVQQLTQVASATLTGDVSVVCWRNQADRLRRARKHVTESVGQSL